MAKLSAKRLCFSIIFLLLITESVIFSINDSAFCQALPEKACEVWDKRLYDILGGARSIAVDTSGNVYVAGTIYQQKISWWVILGFDTNGNETWAAIYDPPGNDAAVDITTDGLGNVYASGVTFGSGGSKDITTIKYNKDGELLWESHYDGPDGGTDSGGHLTLDSFGNVYVTGLSQGSTHYAYVTIKYDNNGNQLSVARYDDQGDEGFSALVMTVDGSGNTYATGSIKSDIGQDIATVKYDTNGNEKWIARYKSAAESPGGQGQGITIDNEGNVYVTGGITSYNLFIRNAYYSIGDCVTIKYDANGNQLWANTYDGSAEANDIGRSIKVDDIGNVYVSGVSENSQHWDDNRYYSNDSYWDFITLKYDPDGNLQWSARYDGPTNDKDSLSDMLVDDAGNVYVIGTSLGIDGTQDYTTIKYDTDGNQTWIVHYNGYDREDEEARCMAIDNLNNIYVTGSYCTTIKYTQFESSINANFSASTTVGVAPLTINFTDQSVGGVSSWLWNFGDTTESILQNPSHIYMFPGEYSVSLKVSDEVGCEKEMKYNFISIAPQEVTCP